jgi:hypothetical protein
MGHARIRSQDARESKQSSDSFSSLRGTSSRLHFDATDNVYCLVKGSKTFRMLPPSAGGHLRTVTPTFGVSPPGVSYQLRKFSVEMARKQLSSLRSVNFTAHKMLNLGTATADHNSVTAGVDAVTTQVADDETEFILPDVLRNSFPAVEVIYRGSTSVFS